MWVTVDEFKQYTNVSSLSNEEIKYFLDIAYKDIIDMIFIRQLRKYTTVKKSFKVELDKLFIVDSFSYDGLIDKNDIKVYELDRTNFTETDRLLNVVDFKPKYGYIEFDIELPTSGKELYVEFFLGRYEFAEMYNKIKLLQRLLAIRNMIMEKPMAAAAMMSASWGMNSVTFDSGAAGSNVIYDNITIQINKLISDLQPLNIVPKDLVTTDTPFPFRRF